MPYDKNMDDTDRPTVPGLWFRRELPPGLNAIDFIGPEDNDPWLAEVERHSDLHQGVNQSRWLNYPARSLRLVAQGGDRPFNSVWYGFQAVPYSEQIGPEELVEFNEFDFGEPLLAIQKHISDDELRAAFVLLAGSDEDSDAFFLGE